jgi:hypothetical protein
VFILIYKLQKTSFFFIQACFSLARRSKKRLKLDKKVFTA